MLLTFSADVSSLCCCFSLSPPRPLALSLWAVSETVIIINRVLLEGMQVARTKKKKKKKVLLPISTILSNLAEEVTVLTLAGSFLSLKRHFYSFSLKEVTFFLKKLK